MNTKQTFQSLNLVDSINQEYFGNDKRKTYLKDDFSNVLHGIVQRSVILEVLIEASKLRHNKKELPDGSTAFGDFDPDNAGFLSGIYFTYEKGWMVDVRQLLANETGAGGKFIKDLKKLKLSDFMNYYTKSKPGSVKIPRLLQPDFFNKYSKDKSLNGISFIENHCLVIKETFDDMVVKSKQLQDKGYFDKIIRNYQALEFHKDNQSEKYDLREESIELPFVEGKSIVRDRKSKTEIQYICKFMNDFAEIIKIYQSLVGGTDFIGSNYPLEVYIERTFSLFSKKIPEKSKKKVVEDVIKYLRPSLNVVGWVHGKELR